MGNPALIIGEVAGWTSQGCFLDNLAPYQLLPTTNYTSDALTPASCSTFCTGYTYFGLEDGTICSCANELNIAPCNYPGWPSYCGGKPAYPMECTSPCSGASELECGNALILNLYMAGGAPSSSLEQPSSSNNVNNPISTLAKLSTSSTGEIPSATSPAPTPTPMTSMMVDPATTALNATGGLSTSTVYETDVITVISCAPTIMNCPARSKIASTISTPVAIVIYSTEWITISSCAAVITNCPFRVSSSKVPIITITLANNPPSPIPKESNVMSTAVPTPGNGTMVPGNATTPGNNTVMFVSRATGNGVVWSSFVALGFLVLGICWV